MNTQLKPYRLPSILVGQVQGSCTALGAALFPELLLGVPANPPVPWTSSQVGLKVLIYLGGEKDGNSYLPL